MSSLLPLLSGRLRTRPGMYIGEPSLTRLAAFLRGYDYARCELRGEPADPFFLSFQEWIVRRLHTHDCFGWDRAILQQCHSEAEAFDRFWQLFDEYSTQGGGNGALPAEPRLNGSITTNTSATEGSRQ